MADKKAVAFGDDTRISEALSNRMQNFGGVATNVRGVCLAVIKQATLDLKSGQSFAWTSSSKPSFSQKVRLAGDKAKVGSTLKLKVLKQRRYDVEFNEGVQVFELEVHYTKTQLTGMEPYESFDITAAWGGIGVGCRVFTCSFTAIDSGLYPYETGGFKVVSDFIDALEQSKPRMATKA